MSPSEIQTLGITIGDPNGIGPEVALKALEKWSVPSGIRVALIGPEFGWRFWQQKLQLHRTWPWIEKLADWPKNETVALFGSPREFSIEIGTGTVLSGRVAGEALDQAITLANQGLIQGIVTAPVSKHALGSAGYDFPGQTEFLAEGMKSRDFLMMMIAAGLRIAVATTHLPLRSVADSISTLLIIDKLRVIDRDLKKRFGLLRPRIAVTGLNPHAGEGGRLGDEEANIIAPALAAAQQEGIACKGPYPADALFGKLSGEIGERAEKFDAYLAMYHDQGLIPIKMHGFGKAVNYTAGLPVPRTSPDHGTAYDIAGKGLATASSMIEALQLAVEIVKADSRRSGI